MKTKPTFVAIDMEALNGERTSVCEIGMVKYVNGVRTDTYCKKIRPSGELKKGEWQKRNLSHISVEELKKSPSFPDIYKEIKDFVEDNLIVCHQAGADMNYLYYMEKEAGVSGLCQQPYADTMEMSDRLLGKKKIEDCYFSLFGEKKSGAHRADEDAEMCAKIFNELCQKTDWETFVHTTPYIPEKERPKKGMRTACVEVDGLEIEDELFLFYDFQGKSIVVSGVAEERKDMVRNLLERLGAVVRNDITGKTDALIVGECGVGPSKKNKAIREKELRPNSFHVFTVKSFMSIQSTTGQKNNASKPVPPPPPSKHRPTPKYIVEDEAENDMPDLIG